MKISKDGYKIQKKLRDTIGQIPNRSSKISKEGLKTEKEMAKFSKENRLKIGYFWSF